MKRFISFSLLALLNVAYPAWAVGNESTLEKQILSKPKISAPEDPFVLVFIEGGCDKCPYGFITNGTMDVDQWKRVFDHVGHLTAYGIFKPDDSRGWGADGRDLAVRAAQSIGRFTGGSIVGAPRTISALANVNKAFGEDLGLRMTHFFHDDEQLPGTPGGSGNWRIKLAARQKGLLESLQDTDFSTAKGETLESFRISFGVFIGEFIFGGSGRLMGSYQGGLLGGLKNGWTVSIVNTRGFHGSNQIVFSTSSGQTVGSVPFNAYHGQTWLPVTISIFGATDKADAEVNIEIPGIGNSVGRVTRPTYAGAGFTIGDPAGLAHDIHLDDVRIISLAGKGKGLIAAYDFEEPAASPAAGELAVTRTLDRTGKKHDLIANVGRQSSIQYFPTSGIDQALAKQLKSHLIDNLLHSKAAHDLPAPQLITNWRLADVPGRYKSWNTQGFTHASAEYYLYEEPKEPATKIAHVLLNRVPMSLRAQTDAASWGHAWLGNVNPAKAALTPNEFGSLTVMTVLEGYRWFSVFTSMSNGHLAPDHYSYQDKARTNADAIYAISQAASWFQSTSNTLRSSVYSEPTGLVIPPNVIFRSRINSLTKEMWFAACSGDQLAEGSSRPIQVPLTNSSGTVTDLATGKITKVADGVFYLPLSQSVHPLHFKPKL